MKNFDLANYKIQLIASAIIVLLIICITVLKKLIKKQGKKKEIAEAADDHIRNENLDHILLNNKAIDAAGKGCLPYEVDYSNAESSYKQTLMNTQDGQYLMVQIVEHTELSARKFVLDAVKGIRFGSSLEGNDIVVRSDGISLHQCEIFAAGDSIYIKNLGDDNNTLVRRRRQQAIVDNRGIKLKSGDIILLGNVYYDILITN